MSGKEYSEDFPDAVDYAFHTLSPAQRIAFESWASEQQQQEAQADAAALAEVLGSSLTPQHPSPELKARLMAQVAHTPQLTPENTPEYGSEESADREQSSSEDSSSSSTRLEDSATDTDDSLLDNSAYTRAARRWFSGDGIFSPARLMAAACLVLAVGFGIWGFTQHQQLESTSRELAAAQASSSAEHPESTLEHSIVEQISMAPDLSMAQGKVNGMPVSVMYSPSHNMAGVSTTNLPALPAGKVYKLWLYDAQGNILGSGILNSAGRGAGVTTMTGQDLSRVTDFGISIEDENADSPSQKPAMLENIV